MTKYDLEFAELHSPLFIKTAEKSGRNLGQKLDAHKHRGIVLKFDDEEDMLLVTLEGRTAMVPIHNVATMWKAEAPAAKQAGGGTTTTVAAKPFDPNAAQVETPQSHVFAGEGKGQTGQSGKIRG